MHLNSYILLSKQHVIHNLVKMVEIHLAIKNIYEVHKLYNIKEKHKSNADFTQSPSTTKDQLKQWIRIIKSS